MKFCLPLLLFVTVSADARWLTKKEAGTVIEKFHIAFDVSKTGTASETIEYALRVQSEDAKVNASIFQIDYNANSDSLDILEAYTLNGSEKTKVDPAAIEDRDKGESKDYDAQKVRTVVFPNVQIGSRLFIRYVTRTNRPVISGRWSTSVALSPSYHIESFKLTVKGEVPIHADVRDPLGWLNVKQKSGQTFEAVNRQTLPGWVHAEKDPYFHPARVTEIWLSTHTDWSEFLGLLGQDYERILSAGVPSKLKKWTSEAARKKTPEEQIQFLMERVSTEFRYFGDWRRHDGGLVPRSLAEIEASRYGDCKDLSTLMTAMLRQLGLEATVALIRRGENAYGHEPDYKLPAITRFNHAIVHVKLAGKSIWLDPTNPVFALQAYSDIAGRPAWLMKAGGGEFTRTPDSVERDFVHQLEYEYRFTGDDTVKVKLNANLKRLAGADLANDLMLSSRSAVLSETLEYYTEGQEVKSYRWVKEPQANRMLGDMQLVLEYEAGRVGFNAGKAQFLVIPDGLLQGPFYETKDRESDISLADVPYLYNSTRRLKDTRLMQELPAPCRVESDWLNVEREVKLDGRDVVITQKVVLKRPYVQKPEFRTAAFRKLQSETKRCFYRSGLLIEPWNGQLSKAEH